MMIIMPKQSPNVTSNICLSETEDFYLDLCRFLCMAICYKCALQWPLKALSEGQNQDGGPALKYESN